MNPPTFLQRSFFGSVRVQSLWVLLLFILPGCARSPYADTIEEVSMAYLHAYERTAQDLHPLQPQPPIRWERRDPDWVLHAQEAPLDHILRTVDPTLPFDCIPSPWIGKPVSLFLVARDAEDCLNQILVLEQGQWNNASSPRSIQLAAAPRSASPQVTQVLQLQHAAIASLQSDLNTLLQSSALSSRLAFALESNQVVLVGPQQEVDRLSALLVQLDRPPPMIRVQAWITDSREVEQFYFQAQPQLSDGSVALNLSAPPLVENNFGFNSGNVQFSFWSPARNPNSENLLINAAIGRSKKSSLAAPSLLCLSGQPCLLDIGKNGYRVFTTPTSPTSSEIQSQVISAGTRLLITPRLFSEGIIDLDLTITISSFSSDPNLTANQLQRSSSTRIRMQRGDVLRVAGVEIPRRDSAQQGLTGLRQLPILRWFFSSWDDSLQGDRFDLFLTAELADQPFSSLSISEQDRISPSAQPEIQEP